MSTIAPPSKPLNPALVDSEHYIDDQIRRTRRALKLVDLAAGLITLAIGLLGFMLLAAVLDHWVVPGGLSEAGRMGVFGLMLLALGWYAWRQFAPLFKPINPVYAAQTIERGAPSLKNSLLNLLLFRTHRQQMSARVYHALEQQAAMRLSSAPIDTSIDRTALLRLGYALLLIVAVCAAYAVLSPKNMAVSAARVFAPWTDIAPPSRVQILDVKPGDASVALGEQVEISAEIDGLRDGERVQIRYSTLDEQLVDQSAPMKLPAANARRYSGLLPPSGTQVGHSNRRETLGVQQDLVYWIEAGDARSKRYAVNVFTRPTITVQKVRYDYPAYTGFPSSETTNTGDVSGLEGTRVTIAAQANKPIKSAYIDFDADGRSDLKMNVDGDRATASFALALREDRRTPKHLSYVLKFTSVENRTNEDPPKYRIEVKPDYAPEVRITEPEEPEVTIRADETLPIGVEARDPDFALSGVRLVGKVGDREATLMDLLDKRHEGRFGAIRPFTPTEAKLKPGDVLEYWAEARDNRRPDANIAMSEHRRLRIAAPEGEDAAAPGENGQQQQQGGQGQQGQPPQGDGQQGDQQQNGQQGAGQQGQPQNNGQEGDQQNGENQGQQGSGGAGAKGQQNDQSQSEQAAGGESASADGQQNAGQSQESNQQREPGQGGGASANDAQQSPNDQQQQTGGGEGAGASGQPQAGNQQQQQQPGQNASADAQPGQQQNGGAQSGQPQDAQQGQQQGAPTEKVSSQGDDDATAMQRIAEHLNQQNAEQQQENQQANGEPASAGGESPQQQDGQAGARQAQQQTGGEQQNGAQGQQTGANGAQQRGQRNDQQQGATGEPASANGQQQDAANSAPDKAAGQAGASENQPQQKPTASGAQSNEPRQAAGDAEQQGAGQQDGERQGADVPRESKPGDGMNGQPAAQPPGSESNASNNQSDAGAGHNSDEQQGSTSQNNMQGAEKRDGDRNQKLEGDKEPPSGANSKRESDSEGGQSGDQAGGGKEGAGQRSDAAGKGSAGQNEAADAGGGRADEQGQGETGSKAGGDQLADGQAGQSSGDQQGAGSQQREAGEGKVAAATGRGGEEQRASGQPSDEQGPDQAGGQQPHQPQTGEKQPQPEDGESASADGQSGRQQPRNAEPQQQQTKQSQDAQQRQPGDQQSSNRPQGGQAGSSQPQGGGQGGVADASNQSLSDEAREDEANLEYARQQTNLVLERLEDQMAKQRVDQNMLKNLGWTEEELRQFVNRWNDLKARATSEGEAAAEAREELDDALRSLGLRKQGPMRTSAASKDDKLQVNDAYRTRPPVEYADRVRAYSKSVSSGE